MIVDCAHYRDGRRQHEGKLVLWAIVHKIVDDYGPGRGCGSTSAL
jgi:hypothetical protein